MNSTPSKVFFVAVMKCDDRSHARKIARLLRAFPHREYGTTEELSTGFSAIAMVKADSLASIQTAIAPKLGKAKAAIGEISFVSDNNVSSEPFDFIPFTPPTRPRSSPTQK